MDFIQSNLPVRFKANSLCLPPGTSVRYEQLHALQVEVLLVGHCSSVMKDDDKFTNVETNVV